MKGLEIPAVPPLALGEELCEKRQLCIPILAVAFVKRNEVVETSCSLQLWVLAQWHCRTCSILRACRELLDLWLYATPSKLTFRPRPEVSFFYTWMVEYLRLIPSTPSLG